MSNTRQLRIPGPTPCPKEVLEAMSGQMINHRGKEFKSLIERVTLGLQGVFQTKEDVLILTSSGTGGMEATVVNTLSPGDEVLAATCGVFGDRFASIAETYGANVKRLAFEWGKGIDPDVLRKELDANPKYKAVLVTHNDTSTGVTNDLATVNAVIKEFDKLILVDAVSSMGSIDMPVDKWHCDVVATGSQKGWMIPPGLAMVSVNKNGWKSIEEAKMPRFYFDLTKARNFQEKGQTPWTPAISTIYALDVGLRLIEQEGLQNVFDRHARIAKFVRERVTSIGLTLFADEAVASNTVTAINAPDGIDVKRMVEILRDDHGVVLSGGQQSLSGKIFRIGHLGWVTDADMEEVCDVLEKVLHEMGFKNKK